MQPAHKLYVKHHDKHVSITITVIKSVLHHLTLRLTLNVHNRKYSNRHIHNMTIVDSVLILTLICKHDGMWKVTGQLTDKPTRGQSSRGLVNLPKF